MNNFKEMTDEKLMELYKKDEYMAFIELYHRHQARFYTYLTKRVKDKHIVEEIFQNIFIKIHKSRKRYNPKFLFLQWAYTICRSELIDYFKYKKSEFVEFDDKLLNINIDAGTEFTINLDDVQELTDKEKQALSLKYFSDKDYDEISQILHIGKANSRKIISRGLVKLRKKFNGDMK